MKTKKYDEANPEHGIYFNKVRELTARSDVLSPNFNQSTSVHTRIFDRSGIRSYILELAGNDDGFYDKDGESKQATIPALREKLSRIPTMFKMFQEQKLNEGSAEPETMPADMAKKEMILSAQLFVREAELVNLQKRVEKLAKAQAKDHERDILLYGPQFSRSLKYGVVDLCDGQQCGKVNGVLVITDEQSLYLGMSLPDYSKHVVKPFQDKRRAAYYKKHEKYLKDLADGVPNVFPPAAPHGAIDKSTLPGWPAGVKNHLKEKPVRTK